MREPAMSSSDGRSFRYSGQELPQMARAVHWKSYIAELVRPHLGAAVLEVGAGIGSNIPYLRHPPVREWTAVEPDAAQAAQIRDPHIPEDTTGARKRFHRAVAQVRADTRGGVQLLARALGVGCFLRTVPGFGRRAARNWSTGSVLMTLAFSSQARRDMVTP